jgi:hypothetical protein
LYGETRIDIWRLSRIVVQLDRDRERHSLSTQGAASEVRKIDAPLVIRRR